MRVMMVDKLTSSLVVEIVFGDFNMQKLCRMRNVIATIVCAALVSGCGGSSQTSDSTPTGEEKSKIEEQVRNVQNDPRIPPPAKANLIKNIRGEKSATTP
jgi:hypothetical protein